MKRNIKLSLALLAFVLLLAAAPIRASLEIDWWSIGPGGGLSTSDDLSLMGMVGQAVGSEVGAGNYELYSGYLYLPGGWLSFLYLPLILK